jgi:hypothetical protein
VSELTLLSLLYDAVRSPLGIVVETSDPEFLRQKLYPLRKREPEFEPLSFLISPINGVDLWILKRPTESPSDVTINI